MTAPKTTEPGSVTEDPFPFRKRDVIPWIGAFVLVLLACLGVWILSHGFQGPPREHARTLEWPAMDIDLEPLAAEPLLRSASQPTGLTAPPSSTPSPTVPETTAPPEAPPAPDSTPEPVEHETASDSTTQSVSELASADTPSDIAPPKPAPPKPKAPVRTGAAPPSRQGTDAPPSPAQQSSPGTRRGGPHAARESWEGRIMLHLDNRKRYPDLAIARREQGVATIRFVVDRSGKVLSVQVLRSTGYMLLDKEIHDLFRRAQPLPPPPPEVAGERIEIITGVQFSLH